MSLAWLFDPDGPERVTIHGLAALTRRRVDDMRFVLSCEGIRVDPRSDTVAVKDLRRLLPASEPVPEDAA